MTRNEPAHDPHCLLRDKNHLGPHHVAYLSLDAPPLTERKRVIDEIRKRVNGDGSLHFRKWARDRVNAILDEVES